MRAREFVFEQMSQLKAEVAAPMHDTYVIPGLPSQDVYKTYRFGLALARARAEKTEKFDEPFTSEGPFGEYAVVSGFDDSVGELIDQALTMTGTPGGKKLMGSQRSQEPAETNTHSPLKGFQGYPR